MGRALRGRAVRGGVGRGRCHPPVPAGKRGEIHAVLGRGLERVRPVPAVGAVAIVIGAVRATRAQRWTRRVPLLILAAVAMLGSWVLGLFVFVNGFVMVC